MIPRDKPCVQFTVYGETIDSLLEKVDICRILKQHYLDFVVYEFDSSTPDSNIVDIPEYVSTPSYNTSFPRSLSVQGVKFNGRNDTHSNNSGKTTHAGTDVKTRYITPLLDHLHFTAGASYFPRCTKQESLPVEVNSFRHCSVFEKDEIDICNDSMDVLNEDDVSMCASFSSSSQCRKRVTSYTADLLASPSGIAVERSRKLNITQYEGEEHIDANLIPTEESSENNIESEIPLIVAVVVEELLDNVCATNADLSLNCSDFQLNWTGLAECLGNDFLTAEDSAHSLQLREALAWDVPITHNDTHESYVTITNMDRTDKDESYLDDGVPEVSCLAVPVYNNYTSLDQLDFALVPIMQNAGSLEKSDDDIDHKRNGRRGNQRSQDSLKLPKRLHCSFPGCSISLAVNRNSKSFRTSRLIRHAETHNVGDSPCPYCNFKGASVRSLRYHHVKKHPGSTFIGNRFTKEQYRILLVKCFPGLLCDLARQ